MALETAGSIAAPTLKIVVYDGGILDRGAMVVDPELTFDLVVTYETPRLAHLKDGRMPGGAVHKIQSGTIKWSGISIPVLGSTNFYLDFVPKGDPPTEVCWYLVYDGVQGPTSCLEWPQSLVRLKKLDGKTRPKR